MAKQTTPRKAKAKSKLPLWVRRTFWVVLIMMIAAGIYENKKYVRRTYRYFAHKYYKQTFKPSDFPEEYDIHGIDVSHFQDVIDWKNLKAVNTDGDTIKFRFAFIKATEGMLIEDDMFDENWEDARDNNIIRGAYHYLLPDRNAALQAANFITSVKLEKGDMPPVVDIEQTRGKSKADVVKSTKEFIKIIQEHYHVKPIIYSNINFIEDYLSDDFKEYPFWVAHYYRDELLLDDSLHWLFWQHSDKADLAGVYGKTDADVFNGDEYEFNKLLIK